MKKILPLTIIIVMLNLCQYTTLFAQQNILYQNNQVGKFTFVSGDEYNSQIKFTIGDVITKAITTQNGTAYVISLTDGTPILEAGYPDLPKMTSSIIVPDDQNMQVQVAYAQYIEYTNIDIAPSKGHLLRTIDPSSVPYTFENVYNNNVYYPYDVAHFNEPYILRDFRAQTLTINPIRYNANTKTLRIYISILMSVSASNSPATNIMERSSNSNVEKEFHNLYKQRFLNYNNTSRYSSIADNGSMLIISNPLFETSMQSFVDWKIQRGMKTVMVNTTATGMTDASIKTYIQNYYAANPELKYVLLVGDDAQVPAAQPGANSIAGPSDNFYGYLAGNDHYPEVFVGRFSGTTITEINTQVQRSIEYEKTPLVQGSFGKSTHIGSAQGPGDDNQMDFEHQRGLRTQLLGYIYTSGDELYDGTQGGMDAAGDPVQQDVIDAVNAGRGIICYTGHGWDQGIGTTGTSNGNVASFTNVGMLPFFWSVACVNGNFTGTTCFAETLLRSTDGAGAPIGCVSTLMSTINQYWNEPMEGQDEMVNLLTTVVVGYDKKTFGALSMNGCMQMNDAYGTSGMDMTDTWTCFGDPSLLVRTATPQSLTASHVTADVPAITSVAVTSNVEGAFVALTMNNIILGTGTIVGGIANVSIPSAAEGDIIIVTVTAYNYTPHIGTIVITSAAAGIHENSLPGITIYPNPATDFISIQTTSGSTVDKITVYDMNGKVVYTNNNSVSGQYNVPADGWAKGTYNVQLTSANNTKTYRVVLK